MNERADAGSDFHVDHFERALADLLTRYAKDVAAIGPGLNFTVIFELEVNPTVVTIGALAGGGVGMIGAEGVELGPSPDPLRAATTNVYWTPVV
ncbi:MAG: hypothetical protein WCI74_20185, partial [Actinomycetes bacterium]